MNEFFFCGGVSKATEHQLEKFLLFFVVGGQEVPMYQAVQNGLVIQDLCTPQHKPTSVEILLGTQRYTTNLQALKLFVCEQGFGIQKRFHSFYFVFEQSTSPEITVKPFSLDKTGYYFRGRVKFLKKREAAVLLKEGTPSLQYLEKQQPMPVAVLERIVSVDRSKIKEGVRAIMVGRKKGSSSLEGI